mmetsp:Transcript_27530/g.48657  ORF Transcript_27530/g.48657 Transcript_27530/m.48657 type:complete len:240 (+) Transcript_27530:440-1159(+)
MSGRISVSQLTRNSSPSLVVRVFTTLPEPSKMPSYTMMCIFFLILPLTSSYVSQSLRMYFWRSVMMGGASSSGCSSSSSSSSMRVSSVALRRNLLSCFLVLKNLFLFGVLTSSCISPESSFFTTYDQPSGTQSGRLSYLHPCQYLSSSTSLRAHATLHLRNKPRNNSALFLVSALSEWCCFVCFCRCCCFDGDDEDDCCLDGDDEDDDDEEHDGEGVSTGVVAVFVGFVVVVSSFEGVV